MDKFIRLFAARTDHHHNLVARAFRFYSSRSCPTNLFCIRNTGSTELLDYD
jgi:hypothetical protein